MPQLRVGVAVGCRLVSSRSERCSSAGPAGGEVPGGEGHGDLTLFEPNGLSANKTFLLRAGALELAVVGIRARAKPRAE